MQRDNGISIYAVLYYFILKKIKEAVYIEQLGHYDTLKMMPKLDLDCVLYVCDITSDNLGLILRSADIFGVNAVYYQLGINTVNNKHIKNLSRNSNIPIYFSDGIESLLNIRDKGYQIIALEITNTSVPLRLVSFPQKTCLVIGNEQNGVPKSILDIAENSCHIEMIGGHISSLNAAIAASIALYEITINSLNKINERTS